MALVNNDSRRRIMYFHKVYRVLMFDKLDIYLLSVILGSILATIMREWLLNRLSEKMKTIRLRESLIKECKLIKEPSFSLTRTTKKLILSDREIRLRRIYKFALQSRGGEGELKWEFSNDIKDFQFKNSGNTFELAEQIRIQIESLAKYLRENELEGSCRIFFIGGRLFLQVILRLCRITLTCPVKFSPEHSRYDISIYTAVSGAGIGTEFLAN